MTTAETRAFFGPRAAGWEARFPDDGPRYERAVAELRPPGGGVALDAGCGTGRALAALRDAVGADGLVIGVDVTPEMLAEATARGRGAVAAVVAGDATHLPLAPASVDSVFAAGLLPHLRDAVDGLAELARVARPGARLAAFHPIGRVALAGRHGHAPDPDDIRAEHRLAPAMAAAGWRLESLDDAEDRYLALAVREG